MAVAVAAFRGCVKQKLLSPCDAGSDCWCVGEQSGQVPVTLMGGTHDQRVAGLCSGHSLTRAGWIGIELREH